MEKLIDALNDRNSPNFHQWLAPEQFGEESGAAPEDISAVTGWLQSHGFQVNTVFPNQVLVDFSGTAGQIREAFRTEVHYLQGKDKRITITTTTPDSSAAFQVWTDAAVNITEWTIQSNVYVAGGTELYTLWTADYQTPGYISNFDVSVINPWPPTTPSSPSIAMASISDQPGTWTETTTGVPEPASLLLLGCGMLGLMGVKLHRKMMQNRD